MDKYNQGVLDTLTKLHFKLPPKEARKLAHWGSDILSAPGEIVKHKRCIVIFNQDTEQYETSSYYHEKQSLLKIFTNLLKH